MILKSIGIKNINAYSPTISYITRDSAALHKDGDVYLIRHNVFGSPLEIIEQLQNNEQGRINRRINSNILMHSILSLAEADADKVRPEMLERLVREFMQSKPDALHVAALHMSKNPHAHIISGGCDLHGLAYRIDKKDYEKLKQSIQSLQETLYPELTASIVQHGKDSELTKTQGEYHIEQSGKMSDKETARQNIKALFELATSREEFFDLLKNEENMKLHERGGTITGIETPNYTYRFSTLDVDLAELDMRSERLDELENLIPQNEIMKDQNTGDLSIEEQRMRELDAL